MPDRPPPRLAGADERAVLRALTQYQRDSIIGKLDGLTEADARRSLVPSGTTLLWLVKHLTMAELLWIARRFAGRDVPLPDNDLHDGDTIGSVVTAYRAAWVVVDAIADAAPLDQPCHDVGDHPMVDLRWVLAHLLEETARHAGHADILRELIDGVTGR
jgi:Protein of unknown function (DUF664)